jgi:hypothetical protein
LLEAKENRMLAVFLALGAILVFATQLPLLGEEL